MAHMETKEIEQYILWRYPFLLDQSNFNEKVTNFGENDKYIFYCCHIKTYAAPDYSVVCDMYPETHQYTKLEMLEYDKYLSAENAGKIGRVEEDDILDSGFIRVRCMSDISKANYIIEGKSTGLAILNKKDYSIKKLIYVKDTYNMLEPTDLFACHEDYAILKTYEVSYIIYLNDFSTFRIDGTDLTDYNGYILIHPAFYYEVSTNWSLVDVNEQIVYPFHEWVNEIRNRPDDLTEDCTITFDRDSEIIHIVDNITGHEGYTCLEAIKEDYLRNKPVEKSEESNDDLPF